MKHRLPELGYDHDALEPMISAATLAVHHGKHHRGYVDTLNELLEGSRFESVDLEEILREADGDLYDNAAQHFNHSLYWRNLTPGGPKAPSGRLAKAIDQEFGDLETFRSRFLDEAASIFGSGWCWLVAKEGGGLEVVGTSNARVPLAKRRPLLTCDVWEHAYYLDYKNDRKRYLERFWDLIHWGEVARALEADSPLVAASE